MLAKGTVPWEQTNRSVAREVPCWQRLAVSKGARLLAVGLVVVLVLGCAGPTTESTTADDTQSASPSDSLPSEPSSSSEPSATPSNSPAATEAASPAASEITVTVAFISAVATKRWGDPPFPVKAKASNGAKLTFTATGGACAVGKSNGLVEIKAVGKCTINAATSNGPTARKSLSFAIEQATPKIKFGAQSVRYTRTFSYKVKVKVSPPIELTYQIVSETSDPECRVGSATGKLTLAGDQPNLTAQCTVEVSAAHTSANYKTPSPVQANIKVDFPAWNVEATSPPVVHWNTDGSLVTVTVRETTGNAYGIDVEQNGGAGECAFQSETPTNPPAGTTIYKIVLELQEPSTPEGYVCNMTAKGSPPDYFDPGGTAADDFTVTVVPG
jgi:hypothetical protein